MLSAEEKLNRRNAARRWYYRNKRTPEFLAYRRRQYKERVIHNLALIRGIKDVPCLDCGGRFPACVMDFDHVRGEKKFSIAQRLFKSPKTLLVEIEKCEIVCSNCHRIRTEKRGQYSKYNNE